MSEHSKSFAEKSAITDYFNRGDSNAARAACNELLANNPSDPETYLLSARSELMAGRVSLARLLVGCARAISPDHPTALAFEKKLFEIEQSLNDSSYRRIYLASRARHMDFPEHIQIETVGRCNAKCTFCPHEQLDRKFQEMSDSLYGKIISDASEAPKHVPINFILNVVNEPFMDKKIFDRIALINDRIPQATFGIFSNLNVLPKNFFERMGNLQNWTLLNVSFNAANRAEYEESMGIDFERTVSNLKTLLNANKTKRYFKSPLVLSRVQTLDQRDTLFVKQCQELLSDFKMGEDYIVNVKMRASWLGDIDSAASVPKMNPCLQWLNISVHCDGTVPHCCMDATGSFSFGNANDTSIIDIYNSPRFRNMRESCPTREQLYPCNTCQLQ